MNRFKNLDISRRAVVLATKVYKVTSGLPEEDDLQQEIDELQKMNYSFSKALKVN